MSMIHQQMHQQITSRKTTPLEYICFLGNFCGCDLKKISFKKIWLFGFRYVFSKNYG